VTFEYLPRGSVSEALQILADDEREKRRRHAHRMHRLSAVRKGPPKPVLDRTGRDDAFGGDEHVAWVAEDGRLFASVQAAARAQNRLFMSLLPDGEFQELEWERRFEETLFAHAYATEALAQHRYSRPPCKPDWMLGVAQFMACRPEDWPACGTWVPPATNDDIKARLARLALEAVP
jgi:hypothetical protein